ncbi:uncharacterized protein Z520_03721 [Fonsecaea multimorphosa CBS 102226]|uniref:FAD-binding domain-containing protein n=1 Tax=Fonsecaea multimorphosa CBS 102226 TaxID=1442371 RepID=A0A0D2KCY9_9EURO|nr:uncharacterized protein Z520_03721 [Fonsecaea multimorphosa CBS 102226]KIY01055.1 hypothetical protein Z520_03721 [Fonsecaea multimorphosa CBS 102226]OAL21313.1 hypothetical protein AYO22_08036 [Fonsecaea multimorphosa]
MKVIIIGSGLAGPAMALALHRHGISCKVFDLRDEAAFDGGFVALAPNALRALDRIGVYDRVRTQGWNYEEFRFLSSRNLSRIATVLNGSVDKYGYKAVRVSRGIVRQTLVDALRQRDIELHLDSKCVQIQETDHDTVIATFEDGRTEEADFLVGADGIHSRVRRHLEPTAVPTFSGQLGVGGSLARTKLQQQPGREMYMPCLILGKLNSFMFMPCTYTGDRVSCFATVEAGDRSREEWATLQNDEQALYKMLQSHHENETWPEIVRVASQGVDMSSLSLWPYYKVPELTSWSSASSRVMVIGDAAHAMPPTGGQGAAMAFEDALTLADTLALLLPDKKESQRHQDHLLEQWQTLRKDRVKKILAFTSKGGDMRKSSPSTLQQIVKEWVMWAYFLFIGEDAGLSWIYEYDTRKFPGYLKVL